ncbi:MAG TPA: hypothetical protein PLL10_01745, partial [Elusimicrobiales bacterium]|nr:hypothetical protein [Elusimicrobiales bacterium]
LALAFAAWCAIPGARKQTSPLLITVLSLAGAAAMLLFKKKVSQNFWELHAGLITTAFWLLPALLAALGWGLQQRFREFANAALTETRTNQLRAALKYTVGAGLAAFLWFHATAFIGVLSGVNVYKRLLSLDIGAVLTIACFLWGGLLVGLVFQKALSAIKENMPDERLLFAALALVGYFSGFTIFRNTNSMRYYLLAYLVFAFAATAFLPAALKSRGPKTRLFLAAVPLLLLGISVKEVAAPAQRAPLRFLQGWHDETSAHMQDIAWLAKKLENDKTCRFEGDRFINVPLSFLYRAKPWACDQNRIFKGGYCYNCSEPPYIR